MTRVPGAPAYVRGLINMRGTIVTVLDLGMRLDPSSAPIVEGSILLLRHRDRLVGVVVEEVIDLRTLEIEDGDAAQRGGGGTIVRGMATLDDAPVVVLDLDALIKQVLLS
jgi:purine-binding chemotaxis protein CheW